jgi:hypothetical protein
MLRRVERCSPKETTVRILPRTSSRLARDAEANLVSEVGQELSAFVSGLVAIRLWEVNMKRVCLALFCGLLAILAAGEAVSPQMNG